MLRSTRRSQNSTRSKRLGLLLSSRVSSAWSRSAWRSARILRAQFTMTNTTYTIAALKITLVGVKYISA